MGKYKDLLFFLFLFSLAVSLCVPFGRDVLAEAISISEDCAEVTESEACHSETTIAVQTPRGQAPRLFWGEQTHDISSALVKIFRPPIAQ